MTHFRPHHYLSTALLIVLFVSTRAVAQSPIDPGKLPVRTTFYFCWHGGPAGDIRKSNSLYALWDDPDFAPARAALFNNLVSSNNSNNTQDKPRVSPEELQQYVTLLDNSFLVGYIRQPESHTPAKTTAPAPSASASKTAPPAWNGMFFIYDRSGKEALLSKAVLQARSAEKDIPKLTELTVAGVPSLKVERKSGITYWAEFDKYAVSANELPVFEEILNVVNGKPPVSVLAQSSSYQEARPLLTGGILEFFLQIPGPDEVNVDSSNATVNQLKPLISALKLESIHSIAGRLTLEGAKSHVVGAILGDTAPDTLFDVWADGQANPVSMGYLPADTVQYGETEFNLPGVYNTLKHAFSSMGNGQANMVALETMAQTRLGMPLPDALNIVTGEIAWIQTSPTLEDSQKVFLVGLRNKPDALKLTRTIMGDQITSERNEGNTTFLKISTHGGQSSAGLAQWHFYYLAMSPNVLFGASKSDTLRKYAIQTPADPDAAQLKGLLAARALLPQKVNGFSYFDFQKVDWPGLQAKWVADAQKAAETAKSNDESNANKKKADWLSQVNPAVFSRHLHTMSGGSWKDAKGVHFDHWLD